MDKVSRGKNDFFLLHSVTSFDNGGTAPPYSKYTWSVQQLGNAEMPFPHLQNHEWSDWEFSLCKLLLGTYLTIAAMNLELLFKIDNS